MHRVMVRDMHLWPGGVVFAISLSAFMGAVREAIRSGYNAPCVMGERISDSKSCRRFRFSEFGLPTIRGGHSMARGIRALTRPTPEGGTPQPSVELGAAAAIGRLEE